MTTALILSSLVGAQRMPLGENFTNWGCPPCRPADSTLEDIYADMGDSIAIISYHGWWPSGSDPYYNADPASQDWRIYQYMDSLYVPQFFIDYTVKGYWLRTQWRTQFQNRLAVPSPATLGLQVIYYNDSSRQGQVVATAYAEDTVPSNVRLMYVVEEMNLYAMGPNGWPYHDWTFRQFLPDTSGADYAFSQGQTIIDTQSFTLVTSVDTPANCLIVGFIVDTSTLEVLQAAKVVLPTTGASEEQRPQVLAWALDGIGRISFGLSAPQNVSVEVYDPAGRLVATPFNGKVDERLSLDWEASSPGVYLYVVKTELDGTLTGRTVTVR